MRNFILGTDWWDDCDDVVALRLLTRYVRDKKINLLGVIVNAYMPDSVASVKGFLYADGVQNVPVGVDPAATDFGGNPSYQKRLAALCPQGENVGEDAVKVYRRILATATTPVEMIEIGYLQAFVALLKSTGDEISPLSGEELVRQKVSKVWAMAGRWDIPLGRENNFCRNARAIRASSDFCALCPVPITFLGYEVGENVITGNTLKKDDHLYHALVDHGSQNGRHSWDPMLVMMALIGDEEAAGYQKVTGRASVDKTSGENTFTPSPNGPHAYVLKKHENAFYENQINQKL